MNERTRANDTMRPFGGGLALLVFLTVFLTFLPRTAWAAEGDATVVKDDTEIPIATQVGDGSIIAFSNLNNGTTYLIKVRKEATESAFRSYQARVEVTTSDLLVRIGITSTRTEHPYNGEGQEFEFTSVPAGLTGFVVAYYQIVGDDFTEETLDLPVDVGYYKVHVTRSADAFYAAVDMTFDMNDRGRCADRPRRAPGRHRYLHVDYA